MCSMNKKTVLTIALVCPGAIMMMIFYAALKPTQADTAPTPKIEKTINWTELNSNPDFIKRGQAQYQFSCKKCHGHDGSGTYAAPSLTDTTWIYPNDYDSIYTIIKNGSPNKKMFGWGKKLKEDDLVGLTLYVKSLSKNN